MSGDIDVVIAGLSNTYTDYITTPEEYSVQRYEGASTIYGPYTLVAYIQEFNRLAVAIAKVSIKNLSLLYLLITPINLIFSYRVVM